MILRTLRTSGFRNLEDTTVEFDAGANVLIGDNGAGKTNFLEAIYLLATTRSFRTARTAALPRFGSSTFFISGIIERDGLQRSMSIGIDIAENSRRRELLVNRQKTPIGAYVTELPVIAYSAARLEIVRGGPEERRRFLDRGISDHEQGYLDLLTRYAKVLRHRNATLQIVARNGRAAELRPWDEELVKTGGAIVRARTRYLDLLQPAFGSTVSEHAYHVTDLNIRYEPATIRGEAGDLEQLERLRRRELAAGFSLAGPHRDAVHFMRGSHPAVEVLSSGEVKMTVLFLKMARLRLFQQLRGAHPLFLLDDVDAELDNKTIERTLLQIGNGAQLFTTAPKDVVSAALRDRPVRRFAVESGRLNALPGTGINSGNDRIF